MKYQASASENSEVGQGIVMQAIMAEYNALRAEIQYRSVFQNNLLKLHVTTLIVLIGAALSQSWGVWMLLVVPLESSILGLWWMDHALSILDIGAYIRNSIESRVCHILGNPAAMGWEGSYRNGVKITLRKRVVSFRRLLFVTFSLPAVGSLALGIIFFGISIHPVNEHLCVWLGRVVPAPFGFDGWWVALPILAVGTVLFIGLQSLMKHRIMIANVRTAEATGIIDSLGGTEPGHKN